VAGTQFESFQDHHAVSFSQTVPEDTQIAPELAGLLFRLQSLRLAFCASRAILTPVSLVREIPFLAGKSRCNARQSKLPRQADHRANMKENLQLQFIGLCNCSRGGCKLYEN